MGSPPHVRGPPTFCHIPTPSAGITPACAGTTFYWNICYFHSWDHPRMCGDHMDKIFYCALLLGSPPHVRGPRLTIPVTTFVPGITPACAGTTCNNLQILFYSRDHPRMCGDHPFENNSFKLVVGSPPHVRGPLPAHLLAKRMNGITPACAGTTPH